MEGKMRVEKAIIDLNGIIALNGITFAPYIFLASQLISKLRKSGGTMFRHQISTFGILVEYGYTDPVLLKASLIHDVPEDVKGFNLNLIRTADSDGESVLNLVLEVTKREGETKADFLKRINAEGSYNAKLLKCADRISNLIDLGYVTDSAFIERVLDETELYILPIAIQVDYEMYQEIISLMISRRKFIESN